MNRCAWTPEPASDGYSNLFLLAGTGELKRKLDSHRPTCLYCNGVIGVYEPILAIEHEGERETSFARKPDLPQRPNILLVHRGCAPAASFDSR